MPKAINDNPYIDLTVEGQVASIRRRSLAEMTPEDQERAKTAAVSFLGLANVFDAIRADDSIRVIVMHSGGPGKAGNTTTQYESAGWKAHHNDPVNLWHTFSGIIRMHEVMASIEKPIVAQVNGDIMGGGCNIVLASDIIVAEENARFLDHHLGMGQAAPIGPPFGLMPGDGGVALAPLYFSPPMAKEYVLLGREFTAKELAQWGLINYALPATQLDAKVNDLVARLLKRPAYPMAWAKRIVNRHVIEQLNRTLDAGAGYEMTGLMQLERNDWQDQTALD